METKAYRYLILILSALLLLFYIKSCRLERELHAQPEPQIVYVDKKGNTHVDQKVVEGKVSSFVNTDSIKALTGIKKRNIKGVTEIAITGSDSLRTAVVDKKFTYKDEKIEIDGHLFGDSVNIKYTWKDTVGIVQHEKGGETRIDVSTTNSQVVDLKSVKTKTPRNKRFGIGPAIGVNVYGKPIFGVTIQYSLIRF
jgi:hypothetical protein